MANCSLLRDALLLCPSRPGFRLQVHYGGKQMNASLPFGFHHKLRSIKSFPFGLQVCCGNSSKGLFTAVLGFAVLCCAVCGCCIILCGTVLCCVVCRLLCKFMRKSCLLITLAVPPVAKKMRKTIHRSIDRSIDGPVD